MAKSTQDLSIWLRKFQAEYGAEQVSIEIFSDKSFRLNNHVPPDSLTIYDSDNDMAQMDINDLVYIPVEQFVADVKKNEELKNIDVSEL